MSESGLRERKKRRTREQIATAAAALFAERGYESVSVLDIADAAEVSEQTVYNHFPTKADLVVDRDRQLRDELVTAIRDRAPGISPAMAMRDVALRLVDGLAGMSEEQVRGGLGHLAVRSPAVRRLSLQMTDAHADAIAEVLAREPGGPPLDQAKVQAIALAWVIQTITDLAGLATLRGASPRRMAGEIRTSVVAIIDQLDRWPPPSPSPR